MEIDEWSKPQSVFALGQNNTALEKLQIKRVQKNLTFHERKLESAELPFKWVSLFFPEC